MEIGKYAGEAVSLKSPEPVTAVSLGEATLQRGYVYTCRLTGDGPELFADAEFGFHGTARRPCAAEYLCDDDRDLDAAYLVISTEDAAAAINTVEGWSLEPAVLHPGDVFDDGTWSVVVVKCHGGHEYTVAGA